MGIFLERGIRIGESLFYIEFDKVLNIFLT